MKGRCLFSAVAIGDDVHLVFTNTTPNIVYKKRTWGVGWGSEVVVQSSVQSNTAPALSVYGSSDLICFWLNTPTAGHVYYKKCIGGTWDTSPTDWINESAYGFTNNQELSSFYKTYGSKVGLVYLRKTSSPYDVRFAYLTTAIAHVQEVSDVGKVYEAFEKTVAHVQKVSDAGKVAEAFERVAKMTWTFTDAGRVLEFLGKGFVKNYADSYEVADFLSVSPLKSLADVGKSADWFERSLSKFVMVFDRVFGEHFVASARGKWFMDVAGVSDYMCKDVEKTSVDVGVLCDYISKTPLKRLADAGRGVDWFGKAVTFIRSLADSSVATDYFERVVSFTRAFTDAGISTDYIERTLLKALIDTGKALDFISKTPFKSLLDAGVVSDYMAKNVLKPFVDGWKGVDWSKVSSVKSLKDMVKGVDWYSKVVAFYRDLFEVGMPCDFLAKSVLRNFFDWAVGEHAPTTLTGKEFRDVAGVSDYMCKDLARVFIDLVVARDTPYRVITVALRDMVFGEHVPVKSLTPVLMDAGSMKDLLTKVAYKIAGMDVRRVYALPREWADIIEPEDHNIRIEICKALLEAMRRLKEKLGE